MIIKFLKWILTPYNESLVGRQDRIKPCPKSEKPIYPYHLAAHELGGYQPVRRERYEKPNKRLAPSQPPSKRILCEDVKFPQIFFPKRVI